MIGVSVFLRVRRHGHVRRARGHRRDDDPALVFNLEPVVAIAGAVVLLGERLSPVQTAGVALVIGALMLATLGRGRVAASAAAANDSESPGSPRP